MFFLVVAVLSEACLGRLLPASGRPTTVCFLSGGFGEAFGGGFDSVGDSLDHGAADVFELRSNRPVEHFVSDANVETSDQIRIDRNVQQGLVAQCLSQPILDVGEQDIVSRRGKPNLYVRDATALLIELVQQFGDRRQQRKPTVTRKYL